MTARLWWDVDQDIDALLNEYYDLYYGPASATMKSLYEYSEANLGELQTNPVHLAHMRLLAEQARSEVAAGSEYEARIDRLLGLMNINYQGSQLSISSCQDLTSPSTTYTLSQDVSSTSTCFFVDADGVTLDCQGHTVTYGSGGPAVSIEARLSSLGHYFTMRNCRVQGSSGAGAALDLNHGDHATIVDNVIDTPGSGIRFGAATQHEIRRNNVTSAGTGLFMQYGGSGGTDLVSRNTIADNRFVSSGGSGAYLYRIDSDIVSNNEFISSSGNGLRLYAPVDVVLENNLIRSDSSSALYVYDATNLQQSGNTIIDG